MHFCLIGLSVPKTDFISCCYSSSYSVFIRCCPLSRDGQIHPIFSAIAGTPSLYFSRFRAYSFFKPIFSVSSSTCFFLIFFGRPRFFCLSLQDPEQPSKRYRNPPQHISLPSNTICCCKPVYSFLQPMVSQHVHLFFNRLSVNNFLTAHGSHHSSLRFP